ncbi:MAG: HEAT repeat domain-containing protein [Actinomycetota bacterium]
MGDMSIFNRRRRRREVPQEESPPAGSARASTPARSESWVLGPGEAGPAPAHHAGAGPVRPPAAAGNSQARPEVPWPPDGEEGSGQEGSGQEVHAGAIANEGEGADQPDQPEKPPTETADAEASEAESPHAESPGGEAPDIEAPEVQTSEAVPATTYTGIRAPSGEVTIEVDPELMRVRALVAEVRASRERPAEERLAALSALEGIDRPEVHEVALAALTHDLSEGVRSLAVRILASAPAEVRLEALEIATGDPQPGVRASSLDRLAGDEPEAARAVLALLDDPDDHTAQIAGEVLVRRIGSDPATVWAALKRSSGPRRERLKVVLAGERPEELERLRAERALSLDPEDRVLAAELVPARDEERAAEAGILLLSDPSARVRTAATQALTRIRSEFVAEALRGALVDPSPAVRLEAVRALSVRDEAASVDALVDSLGDPDARIRAAVIEALDDRASRGLATRLISALEDPRLRAGATELLVSMDRFAEPLLLDALPDRGGEVRASLGEALDQVVGVDELARRLTSVDRDQRETAVEALSAIGSPGAVGQLLRALDDPDEEIRLRAVRRLGSTDDPRAIAGLRATAERDPVRQIALAAKEGLGAQDVVVDLD